MFLQRNVGHELAGAKEEEHLQQVIAKVREQLYRADKTRNRLPMTLPMIPATALA